MGPGDQLNLAHIRYMPGRCFQEGLDGLSRSGFFTTFFHDLSTYTKYRSTAPLRSSSEPLAVRFVSLSQCLRVHRANAVRYFLKP